MAPPRRETKLGAFASAPSTPVLPAAPAPPPSATLPVRAIAEEPPARKVSELVAGVNRSLADDPALANVWVRGEIGSFSPASSGHWYFSLKDDTALLQAVMWRSAVPRVKFQPEIGIEVLVRGRVQVYPQRSTLQISVDEMRPVGAGELALRFEQLRRRLESEGLFAQSRKRALPPHPRAIGIVTSLQAAALRDMVRVATDRHPGVRILVASARVQGEGAAEEIAAAIARICREDVDVLIVGRGGGSAEDLWAFNEEPVVRAVVAARVPVVSAVGHETDFTLCDFAADLRAATPSNACEIVVPDARAIHDQLADADARMMAALDRLVPEMRQRVDELDRRAQEAAHRAVAKDRDLLAAHAARLDALSPLGVLARGYAVVRKGDATLRRAADAGEGDEVQITLQDGALDAKVTRVTRKRDPDV